MRGSEERRMELGRTDINASHAHHAALQQTVRKAAGRSTDVEPVQAFDGNLEMVERTFELLATARDEARRLIDGEQGVFRKRLRGLVDDAVRTGTHFAAENQGLGDRA